MISLRVCKDLCLPDTLPLVHESFHFEKNPQGDSQNEEHYERQARVYFARPLAVRISSLRINSIVSYILNTSLC